MPATTTAPSTGLRKTTVLNTANSLAELAQEIVDNATRVRIAALDLADQAAGRGEE